MMVGRALTDMYPKKAAAIGQAVLRVEHLSLDHPFINGRKSLQDVSFAVHPVKFWASAVWSGPDVVKSSRRCLA